MQQQCYSCVFICSLSFLRSSQEGQKTKEGAKESVGQEEEAEGGRMRLRPDGRASLRKHRGLEGVGL